MSDEFEEVALGDLLAEPPRNGYSPREVDHWTGTKMLGLGCLTPEGFKPVQLKNAPAGDRHIKKYLLADGDVIVSRSNTREMVGLAGIYQDVGAPCIYPDLMMRLRPNGRMLSSMMVKLLLSSIGRRQLEALASGTSGSMVKINARDLRSIRLPLPSLREQCRIIKVLDTLDGAMQETDQIIAKLQQVKLGLLDDLLALGIDENGELRDLEKTPEEFEDSSLGYIPKQWKVQPIDRLANHITSGSRGWASFYADSGPLFLRIGNLTRDHINLRLENLVHVQPPAGGEGRRTVLEPDDLLISITADLGIIGVVPSGLGEAYVNQHIALVRLDSSQVNPRWVGHFLAGRAGQRQFKRLDDVGAKSGLNLPAIAGLSVPVPRKAEQDMIVSILDAQDERIRREAECADKLRSLKLGLMEDLLTGRVRVTVTEAVTP